MRIAGGKFKGRSLHGPRGRAIRPTGDRVREAMFNILQHGIEGAVLDGARVLDVYAGTGALGLEAMSRGARFGLFIDDSATARGLIRQNAEGLGLTGAIKIWRRDASQLGKLDHIPAFDLAFLDPPYGKGLGPLSLSALMAGGWLASGATVIIEEAADTVITVPDGARELDRRTYGDTLVIFARTDGAADT